MEELLTLIDFLAKLGGLVALLGGVLGLAFQERIKHYFAKDLEEQKAKFTRELETYKVTLIAESERLKARQELRKTIALKFAEIEFDRIAALDAMLADSPSYIQARAIASPDTRMFEDLNECHDKLRALSLAVDAASIALALDVVTVLRRMNSCLANWNVNHVGPNRPPLVDQAAVETHNADVVWARAALNARVRELAKLD